MEQVGGCDAGFAATRLGFPERFEHRGDQEVASELDDVGALWPLAELELYLADRLEQSGGAQPPPPA